MGGIKLRERVYQRRLRQLQRLLTALQRPSAQLRREAVRPALIIRRRQELLERLCLHLHLVSVLVKLIKRGQGELTGEQVKAR